MKTEQQTRELLEKQIAICNDYIDYHPDNKMMLKYHLGMVYALDRVLETDSRDRLHMAFTVND